MGGCILRRIADRGAAGNGKHGGPAYAEATARHAEGRGQRTEVRGQRSEAKLECSRDMELISRLYDWRCCQLL
jgi:hypothetical protein